MSDTVKDLAQKVGMPTDILLSKLAEAGIDVSGADQLISDEQKKILLTHLKSDTTESTKPEKIRLKVKPKLATTTTPLHVLFVHC